MKLLLLVSLFFLCSLVVVPTLSAQQGPIEGDWVIYSEAEYAEYYETNPEAQRVRPEWIIAILKANKRAQNNISFKGMSEEALIKTQCLLRLNDGILLMEGTLLLAEGWDPEVAGFLGYGIDIQLNGSNTPEEEQTILKVIEFIDSSARVLKQHGVDHVTQLHITWSTQTLYQLHKKNIKFGFCGSDFKDCADTTDPASDEARDNLLQTFKNYPK